MVGSSASLVICSAATRSVGDVRRAMIAVRGHAKVGCRDHDRGYRHGGAADHQQSPEAGPMRKPVDGQTRQCRYCDPRHPPAHHQHGDKWCGTEQDTESHRGPHAVGRPHRVIAGRAWANARLVQFADLAARHRRPPSRLESVPQRERQGKHPQGHPCRPHQLHGPHATCSERTTDGTKAVTSAFAERCHRGRGGVGFAMSGATRLEA